MNEKTADPSASIAVVGLACRLPGANSVDGFWRLVSEGREGITFFSPDELDPTIDETLRSNSNYVRAKGVVKDADCFDAEFFGIPPMEARIMDPQQRLTLEVCWHALEDAAVSVASFDGLIGVYAGSNWNRYRSTNITGTAAESRYGEFNTALANEQDFMATRIAYKLDLRGPAITVSSACSTSLVAIAEACKALFAFDCDLALAGGASISTPLNAGYLYQEGSMLSADGHCRSFDAAASGTTFNDGVAFVALKRTEDALADGDRIYAVVRGFGVNNDGGNKVSFTAPSVDGQSAAIASALDYADIDPSTVRLVETHGTATPMGDPIEIEALKRAFADVEVTQSCAIGSVKSNIGHLVHAAGAAGFIKTVLSIHNGVLPPSLFFERENPRLGLAESPFFVNTTLQSWPKDTFPRRAGVSSFGVGGTNAHVVLEQSPQSSTDAAQQQPELLCLSARTPDALKRYAESFAEWVASGHDASLASIARVLQSGREHMTHRIAWIAADDASIDPQAVQRDELQRGNAETTRELGFMFSGQGSQCPGMASTLANRDPVFAEYWARGLSLLEQDFGIALAKALDEPGDSEDPAINRTEFAQPALYLFEFALAKAIMRQGLTPAFLIGHSIGEFAAAALAGVFSFEQGLGIVVRRGALMQAQPGGDMLAVFTDAHTAGNYTTESISIAAENAPAATVLSGPSADMEALAEKLSADGIEFRPVRTSHAFHSAMMAPAASAFHDYLAELQLNEPSIPIISTVTGEFLTNEEATSADYWARQLINPVRFARAVAFAQTRFATALVEIGPGKVLATLSTMCADNNRLVSHASCPDAGAAPSESHATLRTVAFAWANGVDLPLDMHRGSTTAPTVSLPGYPFAKTRHWVDERADSQSKATVAAGAQDPYSGLPSARGGTSDLSALPSGMETSMNSADHKAQLINRIIGVLEDVSGFELESCAPEDAFIDLGFDSILLTQTALSVQQEFDVQITFRQLMEDYTTIDDLANFLAPQVSPEAPVSSQPASLETSAEPVLSLPTGSEAFTGTTPGSDELQALIRSQLELMRYQLAMLSGGVAAGAAPTTQSKATVSKPEVSELPSSKREDHTDSKGKGPGTRIRQSRDERQTLTEAQQRFIARTTEQYTEATAASKAFVAENRKTLADPRTVSGFSPERKEMVYPIVTDRSRGSRITDIDGREYIDITNGFGPVLFGHSPDFVTAAVTEQIHKGIETGPQSPLAGEVASLCAELTGNERIAFASTGSEAVCCALRLARTVTGRNKVVVFEGSYHGIFDEVVVRPGKEGAGLPAAPGIPREMTANIVVLPWGTDDALERIREMASQLAAVMVEPVQSRNPGVQPRDFLQSVREITEASGTALIFDEIVTGFRVAPGGAQEFFDIRADLATYGKVVGGGYPIGIVGGKSRFMDALDGGTWEFGDASSPQVGVTFFAGTFVRHPVALAAARAVLLKLKQEGGALQQKLAESTDALVTELKHFLADIACPISIEGFSSYFYVGVPEEEANGDLLFYLLRLYGIHVWQYRPCFLTISHTEADVKAIADAFRKAIGELVRHGLLRGDAVALERMTKADGATPPVEGARLGKDETGAPAWFVPDPDNPGKYKIVGRKNTG